MMIAIRGVVMTRQTNLTHHLFRRRARFFGPTRPVFGPTRPVFGPTRPFFGPTRPVFGPTRPVFGPTRPVFGPTTRGPLVSSYAAFGGCSTTGDSAGFVVRSPNREGRWLRRTPPPAAAQPPGKALVSSYAAFGGCSTHRSELNQRAAATRRSTARRARGSDPESGVRRRSPARPDRRVSSPHSACRDRTDRHHRSPS